MKDKIVKIEPINELFARKMGIDRFDTGHYSIIMPKRIAERTFKIISKIEMTRDNDIQIWEYKFEFNVEFLKKNDIQEENIIYQIVEKAFNKYFKKRFYKYLKINKISFESEFKFPLIPLKQSEN